MDFTGKYNEYFCVKNEREINFDKFFNSNLKTSLSIIWNTGKKAQFHIDNQEITLEKNCLFFLTEFHKIERFDYEKLNVIQFNRDFYCIVDHDSEIGCKGLLFFGASTIPKIIIPNEKLKQFLLLWEIFTIEINENDALKIEMLQSLLKRFLILCLRVYKNQNSNINNDSVGIGIIREFNYLVEQHYKSKTKVADYAHLLNKSPKTLSNLFHNFIEITPIQIINNRRILEAKRLLNHSDYTIQEIASELNFSDVQSFSNFFKLRVKLSPTQFKHGNNSQIKR